MPKERMCPEVCQSHGKEDVDRSASYVLLYHGGDSVRCKKRISNARPHDEKEFAGWTGAHSNRSTEVVTSPIETIRSAVRRREKEASNAPINTSIE